MKLSYPLFNLSIVLIGIGCYLLFIGYETSPDYEIEDEIGIHKEIKESLQDKPITIFDLWHLFSLFGGWCLFYSLLIEVKITDDIE